MNQTVLEALREKREAEKMMMIEDCIGARDKLRRAQQLWPDLANVESMLTVCDIICAAKIQIPGCGTDHYWVLQVTPSSSFSNIKSRYQKLVALLQPVHNSMFPGTELALKLTHEAFSVLSSVEKRSAFNFKRGGSLEQYESLDVQAEFNHNVSEKETIITASSYFPCSTISNQTMGRSTKAAEVLSERTASNLSHSTSSEANLCWPSKSVVNKRSDVDFYDFKENRNSEFLEPGQVWGACFKAKSLHNYRYARVNANSAPAVSVTWLKPVPISHSERRWCDIGLPVACGSFELNPEMNDEVSDRTVFEYKCSGVHGVTEERLEIYPKRGEVWALYKNWNIDEWSYDPDSVTACEFEFVEILSDFSKYLGAEGAWLEKVSGFRSIFQRKTIGGNPVVCRIPPGNVYIFSHNVPSYRFVGGEIDGVVEGMLELDQLALPGGIYQNVSSKNAPEGQASSFSRLPSLKPPSESEPLTPSWSPNDFAAGQVWAVYSGKDLMPRQYTRIDSVISENQVCITLLEPLTIQDYEIEWKRKNLPMVSGMFKDSGTSVCLQMSQFSYLVKCQESIGKPLYAIYPLKGEIWAMYKNWSHKWLQADHDQYQCQVVQILSDFTEGDVITVARLKEARGCLTFFHTQEYEGFTMTHTVPRSEVLGFSHQIPAFRVPGIGSYGIPESSWHLEPKALPPKLYRN